MRRILLIGGCGYIGSRLFTYLKEKKYAVTTVDTERFGNYVNPKNIKKDYSLLSKEFLKKFDTIILLAGHSNYYMSANDVLGSFKNNVVNFVELLEKLTTQTLLYASTSTLYEHSKRKVATEDITTFTPLSYYDLSKQEIDYYAMLSGKNIFGLRLGTVSGYSPNLRTDLILNRMTENIQQKKEIVIHNPKVYRAVLGIEDLCRVVETIILKKGKPGIYNIASFNLPIHTLAKKVSKYFNNVPVKTVKFTKFSSFKLSTKKFEKEFHFTFKETVETILDSLVNMPKNTAKSGRR